MIFESKTSLYVFSNPKTLDPSKKYFEFFKIADFFQYAIAYFFLTKHAFLQISADFVTGFERFFQLKAL